jgi:CRISPR-associated endonuclease/helicase Cas3
MRPHLSLWAKLGDNPYPDCYHPVLCHLIDVAQVAFHLWEKILREPLKKRIADAFGLDVTQCGKWFAFWVGTHNIGKA